MLDLTNQRAKEAVVTDLIGQFHHRVKFKAEISLWNQFLTVFILRLDESES